MKGTNSVGATPLYFAATGGYASAIRALLKAGACINARKTSGHTALHTAAYAGTKAVLETLLRARANVEAKCNEDRTALHCCTDTEAAQVLLQFGAYVETLDNRYPCITLR